MSYHQDTWLKFERNSWKAFDRLIRYAIPNITIQDRYLLLCGFCRILELYKGMFEETCHKYGVHYKDDD